MAQKHFIVTNLKAPGTITVGPWVYDEVSDLHTAPVTLVTQRLQDLVSKFNGVPLLFRFAENSTYDWHVDRLRRCALNFELTPSPSSYTLYGTKTPKGHTDVTRVPYQDTGVLLDTTKEHCVMNLGPSRTVLSVGFNDASFTDLSAYLATLMVYTS